MRAPVTIPSLLAATALGLVSLTAAIPTAIAAPQILAVASTTLPMQLYCEKGECSAELTTICLQEHRASPQAGHDYYLYGDKKLQLTLTTTNGQKVDLTNLPVTLKTARGHTSLRLSLKQTLLQDMDVKEIHVNVPEYVTALPVEKENDRDPQTEADIYLATGPLRQIAANFVDNNTGRADAARLVNHAVNILPPLGRSDPQTRDTAKAHLSVVAAKSGYSQKAVELATKSMEQCYFETQVGFQSLRQCLGSSHDRLIGKLNKQYWRSLNSGS